MTVQLSAVSVDVIALRADHGQLLVGTYLRDAQPYAGENALPGVLLRAGEPIEDGAVDRALEKISCTSAARGILTVFNEPNRDPRGPTVSVVTWAVVHGEWAAEWRPLDACAPLAFDHAEMVTQCRPALAALLWNDLAFTKALTGREFSVGSALKLTEALTGKERDRGNFNRMLNSTPGLRKSDVPLQDQATGRPGTAWVWE